MKDTATPGAWTVRYGVCRNDHPDTSADVIGPQGQFVADCGCHEHANGNAALIAAAPDLKAVAEEAPILSRYHGPRGFDVELFIAAYEAWSEKRRAAILKAEGRLS